mgnify:CR=1 FL=1
MAARLTDKQKKKLIADYIELGSFNAAAKRNGVSHHTVKRAVTGAPETAEIIQKKKEEKSKWKILYFLRGRFDHRHFIMLFRYKGFVWI